MLKTKVSRRDFLKLGTAAAGALVVGQFIPPPVAQAARAVGSLDKTGRDDTVQELRSLAQYLEKIILVSHQEEFYEAFQTGYAIDIVEGASQVKLRGD